MKKYLIPNEGSFYKANLHCHSTVSDGAHTPEEMKEYYKSKGYQILAVTDHELLVDHTDLNDDDFLMLTGYEYAFIEDKPYLEARTIEFNLIAKEPHNETQVCFNPKYVIHGEKWRCDTLKYTGELFEREYTIESMQKVIDEANKNGFLVCLNHPSYSMESPEFFGDLKGLYAMEIFNQVSFYSANDYNVQMYDQMLRRGHRLFGVGGDDNHSANVYLDETDPRPWAHTVIKAKSLEYGDVIKALENGNFYASQGPRINELYIEDGKVYLKCSDAKVIVKRTKNRYFETKIAESGQILNEAVFGVPTDEWMRFEVIDAYGRHAISRAYFLDELK